MADNRGQYQIQLIDPTGAQLDLLSMDRVVALNYTRALNDIGNFTLTIDASDDAAQYVGVLDMIVNIWRKNTPDSAFELDASYLCRYFSRLENEADNEEYIVYAGYSLEHLLTRRVIVPDDDPVAAGGFVTRSGSGDTVMRDFITYQCITPALNAERVILGLSATPVTGLFNTTFQRRSYDSLIDVIKEIAQKSIVDFEVAYTGDVEAETMTFEFRAGLIGTDRTKTNNYPTGAFLLFDPRRGNISHPLLTVDRKDEATFAYVAGQGLEDERVIFPVINNQAINVSIWNRIEVLTDARNNQEGDVDGYLSAGVDTLNDRKAETNFSFEPDLEAPSTRVNVDWFLGDRITAQYGGYSEDLRITKITFDITDDETINIELINQNVL